MIVGTAHVTEDDAVTSANLGCALLLPGDTAPTQHVEDLLFTAVLVGGCRPRSGRDLDSPHADPDRAGSLAEHRPAALEVTDVELVAGSLVEVRDPHAADSTERGRSAPWGARRSRRRE